MNEDDNTTIPAKNQPESVIVEIMRYQLEAGRLPGFFRRRNFSAAPSEGDQGFLKTPIGVF